MTPYLHSTDYVSELFVILRYVLRNFSIAWLLLILVYGYATTYLRTRTHISLHSWTDSKIPPVMLAGLNRFAMKKRMPVIPWT
eukprot:scaffold156775_cov16-Tisochrysis_lutea.AAC.1